MRVYSPFFTNMPAIALYLVIYGKILLLGLKVKLQQSANSGGINSALLLTDRVLVFYGPATGCG